MRWLLIAIPVVTIVGVFLVEELLWNPDCGEEVLSEQKSPDEAFVFTLHRRDCGATTDFATILSIRPASDEFDPSATDDVLVINGDIPVTVSWIDIDKIRVDVPKLADIFRSEQKWEGITITYSTN